MKKISVVTKICISVFLVLCVSIIAVSKPIYDKLETTVTKYTGELKSFVKDFTGLDFSYKSLSPSILSSFYLKNIQFTNDDSDIVLSIKKTRVKYSLKQLFKGNITDFVRSVSINGTNVDIQKVLDVVQTIKEKLPEKEDKNDFEIKEIFKFIPPSININNTSVVYDEKRVNLKAELKYISLVNSKRKGNAEVTIKGKTDVLIKQNKMKFSGKINANGTIEKDIENSSLICKVADVTNGQFKINKLTFLSTFKENNIEVHTVQAVNPFYVKANYNLDTNYFNANVKTENLKPLTIISPVSKKGGINILRNFHMTLNADYWYDVPTHKMQYTSKGNVFVPDEIIYQTANVDYALKGDDKYIEVSKFDVNGPSCVANAELDFIFRSFKLNGFISIPQFTLKNETVLSSDFYFDPLEKGFMAFSPQVAIGQKTLTALQATVNPRLDSYDFEVEVSDYSKSDLLEPGEIKIDGSFISRSKYLQSSISMNSLSVSSVLEIAKEFVSEERKNTIETVSNFAEPYIFTGDAYVSTDLKSLSYNIPYVVVANSKKDNQYLFLGLDGNEQSVQLNHFDLILGKTALNATASLEIMPDTKDMFFLVDVMSASVPYHFSGSIMKELITLSGDYGTDIQLRLKDNKINGNVLIGNLPLVFGDIGLITSLDCGFDYSKDKGPDINLNRLEIEKNDATALVNPKLVITGRGNQYGGQLSSITYTDLYSVLEGSADLMININDKIFDSAELKLAVENTITDEAIKINASVTNPEQKELNSKTLKENLFVNGSLDIHHFSLSRFTQVKNANNEITANLNVSGTLNKPYASVDIEKMAFLFGNNLLMISGNALLDNKTLSVKNFQVHYPTFDVKDIEGVASLENMSGKFNASFEIDNVFDEVLFKIPFTVKVFDSVMSEGKLIPESTMVNISADKIEGKYMKKNPGFDLSAVCTKELISLFSSDNLGLVGTFIPSSGEIQASLSSTDMLTANITGNIKRDKVDLRLINLNANLQKIMSYINLDEQFLLTSGYLKGYLNMGGNFDTPEFKGVLSIANPKFYLPSVLKNEISTNKIMIVATNNEILVRNDVYTVKNVPKFNFGGKVFLNKWSIDNFEANLSTVEKQTLPLKLTSKYININGDVTCNLKLFGEKNLWDISGDVFGDEIEIVSNVKDIASLAGGNPILDEDQIVYYRTNLNVTLGTHAILNFDPFLRCIFVPNTNITINVDTESKQYKIDGKLDLKSGDVSWLNRNFYIKQGSIKFNPSEIANPQISLRAETREKDENGESIQIILIADNQYLLDFNPKFSSIPAKSEKEIRALLGQIVLGDSDSISDVVVTTGDYLLQSLVFRGVENKLRDFMNFDIFSLRTNVLQNTVNMSSSGLFNYDDISLGNFLDNSTVYIGKYLGNALYVDAMVHFSFENGNVNDPAKAKGFNIQPEFGLELELPIANIRWNMAPDIDALMNNQFVPSTSVSLSWTFSF